jgi:hypothetical protein
MFIPNDLLKFLPAIEREELLRQRIETARKGGLGKGQRNYTCFLKWLEASKFDLTGHQNTSAKNLSIALTRSGFKISEHTALLYRTRYLQSQVRAQIQ